MEKKDNLIARAMKHNKIVLLIIAVFVIYGAYSLFKMPKQEFPAFTIREAIVAAVYPGATSQEIEEQVAKPLENFLFTYKEVKKSKTYSKSQDGIVYVFVTLNDDVNNKDEVWSKIKHGLNLFKRQLPSGVLALIANDDFGDTSALLIALESNTKTHRQLRTYSEDLEDRLRGIESVSNLRRYGDQNEQISIYVDKEKIASYGINLFTLYQNLMTKGWIGPSGTIDNESLKIPIHIQRPYASEYEIQEQIIFSDPTGNQVKLKDVGNIVREYPKASKYTLNNNNKCLVLSTEMRSGFNIVDYGKEVNEVLKEFEKTLPNDVKVFRIADQPQVVDASIHSFLEELGIAIIAVILVTMLFMPVRIAGIAGSTIPLSIFISLALMFTLGIELNTVTLAALIVVLGMIVDNSVVILDGYLEKIEEGVPRQQAAVDSAKEYFKAILSATLAIGLTFFPFLLTFTGQMLDFLQAFPWTILITLGVSLMVAVLFVPFLMYKFVKKGLHNPDENNGKKKKSIVDHVQSAYNSLLASIFRFPKLSLFLGVAAAIIGAIFFVNLPLKLMPVAERNQFAIEIFLPQGSSLNDTEKVALDLQEELKKEERIKSLTLFLGSSSPRFQATYAPKIGGSNFAQFIVNTVSAEATVEILDEYSDKIAYHYPNAFVKFKQIDYQAGIDGDVEVRLTGDNIADLKEYGEKIQVELKKLSDPIRVHTNYEEILPDVSVALDPIESNKLGINEGVLGLTLASRYGGLPITSIWEQDYNVPVVLKSDISGDKLFPEDVENEYVQGIYGTSVPLRQVAKVTTEWNEGQIVRRNGRRTLSVYADMKRYVRPDETQAAAEVIVNNMMEELKAKNITVSYGGYKEDTATELPKILSGLGISIVIIYFILVFHFTQIKLATLVFASTAFSFLGGAIGLLVFDMAFSMTAVLGLVSLIGIIVRNGIIMYDYIEELRTHHNYSVYDACIEAGKRRMRPIVLTCLAASMGVIPMIISKSPLWAPMGTVIFFGTLISMLFILTMLPLIYWFAYKKEDQKTIETVS